MRNVPFSPYKERLVKALVKLDRGKSIYMRFIQRENKNLESGLRG